MPFRLAGAIGVYQHGKLLKQNLHYISCDGRYSVYIKNLSQQPIMTVITHRNTSNQLTNRYAPDLKVIQPNNKSAHISVQIPWNTWDINNMSAIDWNIVQNELEIAIATAKEITQDFLPYLKSCNS